MDIRRLAQETHNLLIFAQHMDSLEIGRGVGSVLPEALKSVGAVDVLLNHAERLLTRDEIERAIHRTYAVGPATMVCGASFEDAIAIASMQPNILLVESLQLIGFGVRSAEDQSAIARINCAVWETNPQIRVLHNAGISNGRDVNEIVAAGAQGTDSTSGIIKVDDPFAMREEMLRSVRAAWD